MAHGILPGVAKKAPEGLKKQDGTISCVCECQASWLEENDANDPYSEMRAHFLLNKSKSLRMAYESQVLERVTLGQNRTVSEGCCHRELCSGQYSHHLSNITT